MSYKLVKSCDIVPYPPYLVDPGVTPTHAHLQVEQSEYDDICREAYEQSQSQKLRNAEWLDSPWPGQCLCEGV